MLALLRTFSWQELRHHPWRSAAAVAAVMLGVALAFAVHVINTSALDEFSQAVRAVNGQPDLELRAMQGPLPEALYAQLANHPQVARASPWLELSTMAQVDAPPTTQPATPPATAPAVAPAPAPARVVLRVVGADALLLPAVAPALMPRAFATSERLAMLAPATVFLNAAALQALGLATDGSGPAQLQLQAGPHGSHTVRVAGTVAAGGAPLAVMDIGAAQDLWGQGGRLTRIDLQLQPGADRTAFAQTLPSLPGWPANAVLAEPGDAVQRIGNLSRAYRVNLTVLALVALFTGAFLVFSVLALSVAQRAPQFALLAVLGATPRQRLALVLAEAGLLGLVGSASGIALGTLLAAAALQLLGGDLGGGYFAGVEPSLRWSSTAALLYGSLGLAAALAGGWCRHARPRPCPRRKPSRAWARPPTPRPVARRGWCCWPPPSCWRWRRLWQGCRWPPMCRWVCCWWAAWRCCPGQSPGCCAGCARWWRGACCRCWPWNALGACAALRPLPSAAWWPA